MSYNVQVRHETVRILSKRKLISYNHGNNKDKKAQKCSYPITAKPIKNPELHYPMIQFIIIIVITSILQKNWANLILRVSLLPFPWNPAGLGPV